MKPLLERSHLPVYFYNFQVSKQVLTILSAILALLCCRQGLTCRLSHQAHCIVRVQWVCKWCADIMVKHLLALGFASLHETSNLQRQ